MIGGAEDRSDRVTPEISEAGKASPVYAENLTVHLLTGNCRVHLSTRKMSAN